MREQQKIRVLVIDDSAVMRQLLSAILSEDPAIDVVGTASDPLIAREKIKILKPHVLTLDVEMPGMDGLTFLERLMRLHPLPVVMVSSFTDKGAQATIRALELGAVDFVTKPSRDVRVGIQELAQEIRDKVHAAMHARVQAPGLDRETLSCSPPPSPCHRPPATASLSSAPPLAVPRLLRRYSNCFRPMPRRLPLSSTCRQSSPSCLQPTWTSGVD